MEDLDELERKHYRKFRTGYTYREVSEMVWSHSDDPKDWPKGNAKRRRGKRKPYTDKPVGGRRHVILGKWREIKQVMWRQVLNQCGGLEAYIKWCDENTA